MKHFWFKRQPKVLHKTTLSFASWHYLPNRFFLTVPTITQKTLQMCTNGSHILNNQDNFYTILRTYLQFFIFPKYRCLLRSDLAYILVITKLLPQTENKTLEADKNYTLCFALKTRAFCGGLQTNRYRSCTYPMSWSDTWLLSDYFSNTQKMTVVFGQVSWWHRSVVCGAHGVI